MRGQAAANPSSKDQGRESLGHGPFSGVVTETHSRHLIIDKSTCNATLKSGPYKGHFNKDGLNFQSNVNAPRNLFVGTVHGRLQDWTARSPAMDKRGKCREDFQGSYSALRSGFAVDLVQPS
jgi:hypothetical protein